MFVTSFPPIVGSQPAILILGSMPGGESLRRGQYYAHPRNFFWPIMGRLCGAGPDLPYRERTQRLAAARIALWDVLKRCEREGSLDSSIRVDTEIPNDLAEFIADWPTIRMVGFNGQKAASTFMRRVAPALPADVAARLEFITLLSTSPANASKSWEQKLAIWSEALRPYLQEK